jgi:hypothetical protein
MCEPSDVFIHALSIREAPAKILLSKASSPAYCSPPADCQPIASPFPAYLQLIASPSPAYRQPIASFSPAHRQHITSSLPAHGQPTASSSPAHRQLIASPSPAHRQLSASSAPAHRQLITSSAPAHEEDWEELRQHMGAHIGGNPACAPRSHCCGGMNMCGVECFPFCSACYGLCKQGVLCCHHCIPVFAAGPFLLPVLLVQFCLTVGALTSITGAVCQCWIKKWRIIDKPRDGFVHGMDIKEEPAMTLGPRRPLLPCFCLRAAMLCCCDVRRNSLCRAAPCR